MQPFVELRILRATGETSNTVAHAGSLTAQKAWVAFRLLQQQQSAVSFRFFSWRTYISILLGNCSVFFLCVGCAFLPHKTWVAARLPAYAEQQRSPSPVVRLVVTILVPQ